MSVEFYRDFRDQHLFNVLVGDEVIVDSAKGYRTLGEARWAATMVLVELLDADLPNVEHVVAEHQCSVARARRLPGLRSATPPTIG